MAADHAPAPTDLRGQTALVTGASSGFGADFARQLAEKGCNLVITARRLDRLTALRDEIIAAHPVTVDVIVQDLSVAGASQMVFDQVQALNRRIDLLINNAGFGLKGRFLELPIDRQSEMVRLNVTALQELTWLFVPPMIRRGFGQVLFVSSIAAFQPSPYFASYAASKAFVTSFAHALHYELHGTGVNCLVLSPGASPTEFGEVARQGKTLMHRGEMPPEEVVRQAIAALLAGKDALVPGWGNRIATSLSTWAPLRLKMWAAALLVKE